MKAGFAKTDITPRVGVELCGYGPYECRHSDGVYEPLFARAMALEVNGEKALLVSCDLIGVTAEITAQVRTLVEKETGLAGDRIMVQAIHTHSGPGIPAYTGWGEPDPPYLALLPGRIAKACAEALGSLQEAELKHAEVPCEGIALNRKYDTFSEKDTDAAIDDAWRPPRPEFTDTTCHVLRFEAGEKTIGFCSYYGCHPVIGGPGNKKIHGDWPAIGTNLVEKEYPGSVGLFLQGAQGDINSCMVCMTEEDTLKVLPHVGKRYAGAVKNGMEQASPVAVDSLDVTSISRAFSRKPWGREKLTELLAEQDMKLNDPDADDTDRTYRMAMVYAKALRSLIARMDKGEDLNLPVELQGIRLGPFTFMGGPFEIFRNIKNDVVKDAKGEIPLVMGFVDDSIGYAPDRTIAAEGGYEADMVPFICSQLPFANIHGELVAALLELDGLLNGR